MPDRKQQIKSLFMAAMQIESLVERATYLDECCAGDSGLRADVQELLGAEQNMGGFLEDRKAEPVATLDIPTDELESQMIGPYKTRELLGEGGMGAVYVAEQTEPVRRKVALKLIKPGMDSKAVIARFEAERQALAMMSHPNIAKILDAGTTEQGRPYFVMELVKGIPITKFCDQHKLSTTQRLELFSKVCQAVQHAHLKGIIHRDLKPSNVIVEVHDVEPVPKVIDFGIAKATNQQLTEQTIYTQHTQLIGTPLYMSPEQAQLSALDIDTRSDIYSLGVLLYELLSGTTPFERSELGSAGLDDMRRIICEVDPPRPSHQVSTLNNELASTISERRQTDRRNLSLTMQRELDWIVMKAMEKDRTRRYESASTLADDIRRYIENEPVLACPPSIVYRMRKHVHRHRTTFVGSLVMVVTMLIVASTMYYYHSEQQQRIKQEQNRLTDIRSDVEQTLQSVRTAVEAGDLELASKNLDQAKGQLDRSSEELPGVARDFDKLKVEVTKRIEDQKRFEQLLVLTDDAESKMTHSADLGGDKVALNALGLFRVVDDADWLEKLNNAYLSGEQKKRASEVIYDTLVCLADFHVRWPSWCSDPASIKQSQAYLDLAEKFHQPTRASYWVRSKGYRELRDAAREHEFLAKSEATHATHPLDYYLPGHTAGWDGDLESAMTAYREALRLQPDHYNSLFFLAHRLKTQGRHAEALGYWTACIALRPDHLFVYNKRNEAYVALGNLKEARRDYEIWLHISKDKNEQRLIGRKFVYRLITHDHLQVADGFLSELITADPEHPGWWNERGNVRGKLNRNDDALKDFSRAIALDGSKPVFWSNRGFIYAEQEELVKARSDWEKAVELNIANTLVYYLLSLFQLEQNDLVGYQATCAHLFDVVKTNREFEDEKKVFAAWMCALAPKAMENYSRATQLGSAAVQMEEKKPEPQMRFPRTVLGAVLFRMGRLPPARENLQLAIDARDDSNTSRAYPWYFMAMVAHESGKPNQATSLLAKANDLAEKELNDQKHPTKWNRKLTLELLRTSAESLILAQTPKD